MQRTWKLTIAPVFVIYLLLVGYYIYEDVNVNFFYHKTSCKIISGRVEELHRYSLPKIQVTYTANQSKYTNWTPASRLFKSVNYISSGAEFIKQYTENADYDCWYNPDDPNIVYLQQGYHYFDYFQYTVIFLFIMIFTLPQYLDERNQNQIHHTEGRMDGLFIINKKFFYTEYTYLGDEKLTSAMLPDKLRKLPPSYQNVIAERFNKNKYFIASNRAAAYGLVLFILGLVILIVMNFVLHP